MEPEQLSILNPRPARLPGPDLLHHLVAPASDLVALEYLHERRVTSFSYGQIHNLSDALAGRLLLARGDDVAGRFVVPVLVRQSPELYIALLAVLKAGGAFCPLNPDDPPERIGFIVKDVAASVVVAAEELAHRVPRQARVQVLRATAGDAAAAAAAGSIEPPCHHRLPMPMPWSEPSGGGLAYVMYTSGSTGVPKGVGISHLAASQALLAHDARLPSFSRFLQFAAPTFDISVFEIFFTWHRGATLVSADRDELLDDLPAILRSMEIDACELTPTVAASLLRTRGRAPELKLLLTIGEMLNEPVVREFGGDDSKESLLWAMYGPTEATIHCTLQPHFSSTGSVHNIGTPLDTVSCFVIEPAQSPEQSHIFRVLPRGEIGELAVGGHQIAEEYLNRPDQTSNSFISTPYGRVYRTGDRSRLNPDGTLDCLGRLSDGQVKLRGQRLELGEVEAAILRAPACHGAVAAVLNSSLVVFCAVDDGAVEEEILGYAKRWLPMFMVPGFLILMKEFPKLPSGKIDKKKLRRDYEFDRSAADDVVVAKEPATPKDFTEDDRKIFGVISQVLDVVVTKQTKLASVGLDSLRAISLAATLRDAGFETNVAQLLTLETVGDLCFSARPKKTETQREKTRPNHLSRMKDLPRFITGSPGLEYIKDLVEDILPCHPLQLAMLAATTQYHEAYWNDIELEVEAGITVEQLTSAIHELVRQNEILRTGFLEHDDGFAAIVFKTFDQGLFELVDSFHGLNVSSPEALLHPLRLQVLREQQGGRGIRILLQIHHAIYDGWSMDIILSDLSKLLRGSNTMPRPDFRRFIQFFNEITTKQSDDDRAFWSEYLLGWKKKPFPKLRNRPTVTSDTEICRESIKTSPAIVDGATSRTGCSAQVFFQAALAMIWGGICGSPDIVIGSVLSGRAVPVDGIEGILGPCLASMPLRIDLARARTLSGLLMSITWSNREIMEHSSLPLVQIKKLVRGLGFEALYDVLFIYQQSLFSDQHEQNTIRETRHLDRLETKLLIEVEPARDGYRLQATYHTDAFNAEIVGQILQQLKGAVIHFLGQDPGTSPSLQFGIEAQKSVFNDTPATTAHELDLALLFEAAATKTPHADAISFKTKFSADLADTTTTTTISYEALNRLSNRVANRLIHQGARPGDVVAIFMEKSHLLYASILGIAKARCGYLPLLPSTPLSRVRDILLTSGVGMCIGDAALLNNIRAIKEVKYLEVDPDSLDSWPDHNPEITTDDSRLAYVMYTSGTSGVPKGVAVTQRNIVSNILHLGSTYPTAERNPPRLLQACSQAFDVSVFEIFFAWHMGMCLCAATNDALFEDIEHAIRQLKITHLSLTPSAAALIDPGNVPDVEFLVTAGEPMIASVMDRWGGLLWQGYGPSETTNICIVKRMTRGEHVEHLGWVFPNTSVVVLKPESHEVVPVGWVGELCFGGDQVAAGYHNMPDLTAEKFINHPSLGRIYRSGDLGRMLPDGSLVILGRLDDQIQVRGQRTEAKEINSVITGIPKAVEAVTIPVSRDDVSSSDQLVSFYATDRTDGNIETREMKTEVHHALLASLTERLPAYEVPSYLVPLSGLPPTANSKIDRERLESCFANMPHDHLEVGSRETREQDDSEWTGAERSIADAIQHSLGVPMADIGRWTPFASLGLHSISAIGVARDLRTRWNARVPISAILQNPTVAQLGRFITAAATARLGAEEPPKQYLSEASMDEIKKDFCDQGYRNVSIFPCSPLQEAMLSQGRETYYNRVTLRLRIRADMMKRCWHEMVRRHDILRTCFVTTNDPRYPIAQVLLDHFDLPWGETNIQGMSLDTAVRDHANTMTEPLNSKVPPFSLAVLQAENESFLSLVCHHALYDGVAMEILYREVESLALGDSLLPPVPYQPFLQEMLNYPPDAERFWKVQLWRFTPPGIFSRPSHGRIVQSLHTTSLELQYDEVQDKARSLGLSLLSLCQAAWAQVLSLCSNRTDVCFGCVMSGRTLDIVGLDRLVAPCFNTVPLRKDVSRHPSPPELAKAFHRLNSSLIEYQFTPLRMIQNKIVGTEGVKLFDTLLILQLPHRELDGRVWSLEEDFGEMDLPVVCEIVPCPGSNSVTVYLHYHGNIVDENTSIALADAFKHFFRSSLLQAPSDTDFLPSDALRSLGKLAEGQTSIQIEDTSNTNLPDKESWTELELQIQDILSELSGVPARKIHRDTSIYRLGLDSINAVQIASMLRHQGRIVSASDVIGHQTCKTLAEHLLQTQTQTSSGHRRQYDLSDFSESVLPQISAHLPRDADLEALLPCTPIQCAMLASFTQSGGEYYLNMSSFVIDNGISKDQLMAGWESLRSCHPMFRTGFVTIHHNDSAFAMVRYRDSTAKEFYGEQIQGLARATDLESWKKAMASQTFGAMHLPPWRVAISEGSSGLSMHVLIHHALYDAQSLDSMLAYLTGSLRGRKLPPFPSIEPALQCILSGSIGPQPTSQTFWEEKAEIAVVNKFPLMTPLRESKRTILFHETTSSLAFSVLQRATRERGVTVQAILQAAWTRILSSYLGEDSVVFGVVLSGRTLDETRDAPFPCMVTVPIVAEHQQSNEGLVAAMMEYNRELHKHQFVPLGQVQKWLGHPGARIFDTLLVYQKFDRDLAVPRFCRLLRDDASVDYPVSIEVEPTEDNTIKLGITFFSDILPMEQASLLLSQFDAIIQHLVMHPDGHADEAYRKTPGIFSITPASVNAIPAPVTFLHQFVEERALSHPNDSALEFVSGFDREAPISQTWTYEEFDSLGNRVANMLKSEASVGSIIAIHFEKCPEAYVSILGILKAGCSFVALDVWAPKSRKEFIIGDSQAPCLLISSRAAIEIETKCKVIRVGLEELHQYSPEPRDLGPDFSPNATCYCLYTSGTTGLPKGCEITHDNCVQAMMAFQDLFRGHWQSDSRWLQFAALHFDVSVLEQYWSWSVGITVVAATRDLILDDLLGSINRLRITHIDLTPSLARLTHPDDVPGLCKGVFITGGEALKQEILDDWGPKEVIYNAYGPTEATIGVTMYQRVPVNGRPSNIGKQFLNVGSYVFQRGTEIPVLRGGVGELCVSGKLVGKGYLNRPELTEERFPTLREFGDRIYRTGDLVRILHDGSFEFLGRADDQVKLRGQRLEIGEINHVIRTEAPDVIDVATLVMQRGEGSQKDVLVSFLVGQQQAKERGRAALWVLLQGHEDLVNKAREACRAKLPTYMVPSYFLVLPYIPLSPNNKVEAKELKRLFEELSAEQLLALMAGTLSNRQTDAELTRRTIEILAEFCHMDSNSIRATTSIFDLGVDSIVALQLSTFFRSRGLGSCTPALLLLNPIVADLSHAISRQAASPAITSLVQESKQIIRATHHRHLALACHALMVMPRDVEYLAPCSALQQGIISKSVTSQVRGLYFNNFELELAEDTSVERLMSAWSGLIADEAIFRTRFVKTVDGYVQVALKVQDNPEYWREREVGDEHEFCASTGAARQDWVERNLEDDNIKHPFEVWLVRGPSKTKLLIHIFHALYDGNSFDLMMRQVEERYHHHAEGSRSLGPSFLDALCHGPLWRYDECRDFWGAHLRQWQPSPLPRLLDSESPGPDGNASSSLRVIDGKMLEAVRKKHNVTLQSVVMALWAVVLQELLDSQDGVSIGVIVSGRSINLPNAGETIGPLFNTLPFFHDSASGQSWTSVIRTCHEFNISILPFQHVPLKQIQRWCSGGRPLFDNVFVFMVEQGNAISQPELWKDKGGPLNPDYPLALEVTKLRNGDLRLYLVSQSQVADVARLEEILRSLEKGAEMMAAETPLPLDAHARSNNQHPRGSSDSAVAVKGLKSSDEFIWNDQAIAIRNAVAAVADVPVEEITATRTMLEIGLDSVDVIQLSAKLRSQGVNLPASAMMRLQTISRMSVELITQSNQSGPSSGEDVGDRDFEELTQRLWRYAESQEGIDLGNIEAVLPPTPLQESMVAGMVHSNFEWYFNHDLMEVAADLDLEKLQYAWDQLVMKSPILRTGFLEVEDPQLDMGYCQLIYKERAAVIEELEIQSLSEVRHIMQSATEYARERHGRDGLFQLKCVECQGRHFFVVSMAHAMFDGWSLGLTYHDLEVAYHGEMKPRAAPQAFIRRLLASQTDNDDARFWTGYLDGASRSLMPLNDLQDPANDVLYRRDEVSTTPLAEISDFCKKRSVSLQTLVQACWATVLAHRTGSLDVVFGVVLSGRDFEGAEDLMFPTMNTVPLRCILHGTSTEFLGYLEAVMMDVRDHQSYPLRKMQTPAKLPVSDHFNTLCILQKAVFGERSSKPLLRSVDGSSAVEYPVCVEAEATRDGLVWRVACQGQFMTEEGTSQLVRDLDHVLAFVTRSEAAALLSFHGEEVSICGLSRVFLSSTESGETASVTVEAVSSESQSEEEIAVRRCLSRVANIAEDSIPTHVSLYHLGLDSISALKVCSFLRREGYHIHPRDLLKATSLPQMAAAIRRFSDSDDDLKVPNASSELWKMPWSTDMDVETLLVDAGISRQHVELLLPALPMQAYMMSAWLNSQGAVFFPEFRYLIDGPSDVVNLDGVKLAWESLVAELPVLRTIILPTRSRELPFLQVVLKPVNGAAADGDPRPMMDFCASSSPGGQEGVQIRLRIHHALYDGVSLPAMMRRLLAILQEQGNKPTAIHGMQQWSTLAIQPTEQRAIQARKSFWTEYLGSVRPSSGGEHDPPAGRARVSYLRRAAVGDLGSLRALTARHGVSLQALFLAAYAQSLSAANSAFCGGDMVLGVYLASRLGAADLGVPPMLPTLNLVPLRARAACGAARLVDVARQMQEDLHAIGSEGRARVGLWEVADWTGVTVDSFVNFFSGVEGREESGGAGATLVEGGKDEGSAEEDYSVRAWERFRGVSTVGECFPPAIDVEAAVKDGALDVGVFGSRRRISDDAAAKLVDDIVGYLSAAGSEA